MIMTENCRILDVNVGHTNVTVLNR